MIEMALVLYCDNERLWTQTCALVESYSRKFFQLVIVLNVNNPEILLEKQQPHSGKYQILSVSGGLLMASALNKMLIQILTERFLLLDVRYTPDKELVSYLYSLDSDFYRDTVFQLSLYHDANMSQWSPNESQISIICPIYGLSCYYTSLLSWGAVILSTKSIIKTGGFNQQLQYDAMMIDLSWKLQFQEYVLLQSKQSLVQSPKVSRYIPLKEQLFLIKKYPEIYPKWLNTIKGLFRRAKVASTKENLV